MARQAFICETCFTPFEKKENAEACESTHCSREGIKLYSLAWDHQQYPPSEVVLEIPNPFDAPGSQQVRYLRAPE